MLMRRNRRERCAVEALSHTDPSYLEPVDSTPHGTRKIQRATITR